MLGVSYRAGRKVAIGVVGLGVLLVGIAMLALPGPAVVVIPLGLGILAAEFAWARRWLKRLRDGSNRVVGRARGTAAQRTTRSAAGSGVGARPKRRSSRPEGTPFDWVELRPRRL